MSFDEPPVAGGPALRVLVVGNGWSPTMHGGLNRYVRKSFEALIARGATAGLAVHVDPKDRGTLPPHVFDCGAAGGSLVGRFRRIRSMLSRHPADVYVAHFALTALPLVLRAGAARPLVFHFHGPWSAESAAMGEGKIAAFAKRVVEQTVFARVTHFVVLSRAFAEILENEYGVDASRVSVVPPGVDAGPAPAARPRQPARFVVLRRLVPRMGHEVLLDAWASIPHEEKMLVVLGDGPLRTVLEGRAAALGLERSVEFRGHVSDDEITQEFELATASVVPTVALEGFGLVALESMARGTPVIGTDCGGLGEFLAAVSPEWVVRAGDAAELGRAIERAINDPAALLTSAECRAVATARGWSDVADDLIAVYSGVHRSRKPGGPSEEAPR